jgi:hypothetical protein
VSHALRNTYGPNKKEVDRKFRVFYNEEQDDLLMSPSNIRIEWSERLLWTGSTTSVWHARNEERISVEGVTWNDTAWKIKNKMGS